MSEQRPRDTRERIEALAEKVDEVRQRLGFGTRAALFQAIIERFHGEKLREREFSRQVSENGNLNSTYERCLCNFIGLDWLTQKEVFRGSLEEFRAALDRLAAGIVLVEDLSFVDADKISNDLAMLSLAAPTEALPETKGAANLTFTLNCPGAVRGDGWSVKAGWLEFDLGTGYGPHVRDRRGFGEGIVVDNARIMVHDPDPKRPSWHVQAVSGKFIGMLANVPSDFLLASGLSPPHDIRIRLRVCVANIGVSFELPDGHTEKAAKTRLKQRLAQLKAIVDDDGKAVLASIAIRLKARPNS
jgi:hypothetical protein